MSAVYSFTIMPVSAYLTVLAGSFTTTVNTSGDRKASCLAYDFKKNVSEVSLVSMTLAESF